MSCMCRIRRSCLKDRIATIELAWHSAVRISNDGEVCCDRTLSKIGLIDSVERLGTELGNHQRMEVQCAIVTTLSIRPTAGPSFAHRMIIIIIIHLRHQLSSTSSAVLANAAFLCSQTGRSENLKTVGSFGSPPSSRFSLSHALPGVLYTSK